MFDGEAFGAQMVEVVRQYVEGATAPLLARIEAQERELAELREREPDKGDNGRDGVDGRDADPEVIRQMVAKAVAAMPAPAAGKDGAPGKDGLPGERGLDGADGRDGRDGRDGIDGIGLAGALIDRDGVLNLTLSNGEVRALGRVVGHDGKDGTQGAAGFGLTDFDTDWRPEEKLLVLSWDDGQTKYSHELFLPYLRDAGVWSEGGAYKKGDCVTWGGSLWTAQDDTSDKPETSKAWRLAVKRGRDAKPASLG